MIEAYMNLMIKMQPKNYKFSKYSNKKNSDHFFIYGKHAVREALANPKRVIFEILLTQNNFADFAPLIGSRSYKIVDAEKITDIVGSHELHQGIAVLTTSSEEFGIEKLPANISRIAILDQITDPHNIGAIIRSAAAFNIDVIIMPKDNSPEQNGIIAKIASGALEHVTILKVTNLVKTIETLKEKGFWVVGFDGSAKITLPEKLIDDKLVVILGSEGYGMRQLTKKSCDIIAKIMMTDKVESLNVSNAAAIIFHELYTKRKLL